MSYKPFILVAFLLLIAAALPAQNLNVNEESDVQQVMKHYQKINKQQQYIDGWRVMILSTTDRQMMESVRSSFKQRYPYLSVTWVHNPPYFKLRAGAFQQKLEALRLQHALRDYYPGAYPARDNKIRPEEIIGSGTE